MKTTFLTLATMASFCCFAQDLTTQPTASESNDGRLITSLNIKKNFQFNMLDAVLPSSGNDNTNIVPYLGLGLNDEGILGQFQLYAGLSIQRTTFSGDFNYADTQNNETANGNAKASFGAMAPFLGVKYFLKEGSTRPYVNVQRIGYVPTFNLRGEIEVNGERESFESSRAFAKLARGLVSISATELGFGVEHMFNENLGLFAEYNLRTFQVKLKVDADEFVDDLEDALNELEAGTSVETDLDDFQFIQGDATAKFRNLTSYASLGLALYF